MVGRREGRAGSRPRSCVPRGFRGGAASRGVVKFLCSSSYLFFCNIYEAPGGRVSGFYRDGFLCSRVAKYAVSQVNRRRVWRLNVAQIATEQRRVFNTLYVKLTGRA